MTTKWFGSQVSWKLDACVSAMKYADNKHYFERCCLPTGDYILTCMDSNGDGWNGAFMEIRGYRYCDDFNGYKVFRRINISGIDIIFRGLMIVLLCSTALLILIYA